MAHKNTLLKPYVSFRRAGSEVVLHYPCEYVEVDSNGDEHHFGTRQERDRWLHRRER